MQGALRSEWPALYKERNAAVDCMDAGGRATQDAKAEAAQARSPSGGRQFASEARSPSGGGRFASEARSLRAARKGAIHCVAALEKGWPFPASTRLVPDPFPGR